MNIAAGGVPAGTPVASRRLWTMAESRAVLIAAGALAVGVGALVLVNDISPVQYPAILAWMVGALIVHDVLIAGLVFAAALAGRRASRRLPAGMIVIFQSGLAVGAIVALVVVPEIVKKSRGTANPTVLPLDYGFNLAVFVLALALATIAAALLHAALARQSARVRPPA
jgi:hypothetical protein